MNFVQIHLLKHYLQSSKLFKNFISIIEFLLIKKYQNFRINSECYQFSPKNKQ